MLQEQIALSSRARQKEKSTLATLQESIHDDSFPFAELDKAKIEEMRVKAKEEQQKAGGDKVSESVRPLLATLQEPPIDNDSFPGNQYAPKMESVATLQPTPIDDDSFPDPPAPKETARVNAQALATLQEDDRYPSLRQVEPSR